MAKETINVLIKPLEGDGHLNYEKRSSNGSTFERAHAYNKNNKRVKEVHRQDGVIIRDIDMKPAFVESAPDSQGRVFKTTAYLPKTDDPPIELQPADTSDSFYDDLGGFAFSGITERATNVRPLTVQAA